MKSPIAWALTALTLFGSSHTLATPPSASGETSSLSKRQTTDATILFSSPASGNTFEGVPYYDWSQKFATFTAHSTRVVLTLLVRNDPTYFGYDDFVFSASGGSNLVTNPGFETGGFPPWFLVGVQGLGAAGVVESGEGHTGNYGFYDGAVGGVDGISQVLNTVSGTTYTLSFWVKSYGTVAAGYGALTQVLMSDFLPPTNVRITAGTDSGSSNSDGVTNIAQPVLTGSVAPKQGVNIYVNGNLVGSTTSGQDGTFSFQIPSPLSAGSNTITTTATIGNSASESSSPLTINYIPFGVTPTLTLNKLSDSGNPGDGITDITQLQLSGTAVANTLVTFYDGDSTIGSVTAAADGTYSFTTPTLSIASHRLVANLGADLAGNPRISATVFINVIAVPSAPTMMLAAASDTGTLGDFITTATNLRIVGVAAPSSTVALYDGDTIIGTGLADIYGSYAISTGVLTLAVHNLFATTTLLSGEVSPQRSTISVRINPLPPIMNGITPATDSGIQGDLITSYTDVGVTGTTLARSRVTLYESGELIGLGTSDTNGIFSIVMTELSYGSHKVAARVMSLRGTVSDESTPLLFNIVVNAPVSTTASLNSTSATNTTSPYTVSSTASLNSTSATNTASSSTASSTSSTSSSTSLFASSTTSSSPTSSVANTTTFSLSSSTSSFSTLSWGNSSSTLPSSSTSSMASSLVSTTSAPNSNNVATSTTSSAQSPSNSADSITSSAQITSSPPTSTTSGTQTTSSFVPPAVISISPDESFAIAIQVGAQAQANAKRQTTSSSFLALDSAGQLSVVQSCAGLPTFHVNNSRLTSGLMAAFASPALVSSFGSGPLTFTPDVPSANSIQTTFGVTSTGAVVWSNAAFPNGVAQFCLAGGVLQAVYSGSISSIPGCTAVTLMTTSASVCAAAASSVAVSSIATNPSVTSASNAAALSTSASSVTLSTATSPAIIPGITVVGVTISVEINIYYGLDCSGATPVKSLMTVSSTITKPLYATPSSIVIPRTLADGTIAYETIVAPCGICQQASASAGQITVIQTTTNCGPCATQTASNVASVIPCSTCAAVPYTAFMTSANNGTSGLLTMSVSSAVRTGTASVSTGVATSTLGRTGQTTSLATMPASSAARTVSTGVTTSTLGSIGQMTSLATGTSGSIPSVQTGAVTFTPYTGMSPALSLPALEVLAALAGIWMLL